nr:MAG TPA: hypothetical protein [Caudoviricetes sp.]
MQLQQRALLVSIRLVAFSIDRKLQVTHQRNLLPYWGFQRTSLTLLLSYILLNLFRYYLRNKFRSIKAKII